MFLSNLYGVKYMRFIGILKKYNVEFSEAR